MKKLLIALILLFAVAGCAQTTTETTENEQVTFTLQATNLDGGILFQHPLSAGSGSTAFDALVLNETPMEYEEFSFGVMIKQIGTLTPTDNQYLAIYVDGKYASAGISELVIEEGMLLEFRVEEIEEFHLE